MSKVSFAIVMTVLVISVAIIGAFLSVMYSTTGMANQAIEAATGRMNEVVEKDNPAALAIACSNTNDPIVCEVNGEAPTTFVITYFAGDNEHRTPFATRKVWVREKPQILFTPIQYK